MDIYGRLTPIIEGIIIDRKDVRGDCEHLFFSHFQISKAENADEVKQPGLFMGRNRSGCPRWGQTRGGGQNQLTALSVLM